MTEFNSFIKTELENYIDTNNSPETSPLILWDCAKAFLRGRIISFTCARKRQREAKERELEDKIKELEYNHKQSASTILLKKLKATRRELDSLLSDKIEGNLRFTNQKYYEHGNRASSSLAFRLRKQKASNIVQKIKSQSTFATKPEKIAESFKLFYKSLYKNTDICTDDKKLADFLKNIKLPELSETTARKLDKPLEEWEVKQVISTLKKK